MGLFDFLKKKTDGAVANATQTVNKAVTSVSFKDPKVNFGHYTDANKNKKQLDHWKKATELFGQKKYVASYNEFFYYLRDEKEDNVTIQQTANEIKFSLYQGSKRIDGYANNDHVYAETVVADFEKPQVGFMRKLLNMNYTLRYSKFAIKDNSLCMKFSTTSIDGSPTKLYHSLKELSNKADQQDDILVEEFSSLKPVETGHIMTIHEAEKETKYKYFKRWIEDALKKVSELDMSKSSGGISFIILSLIFKIDYLLAPKGSLISEIEKISGLYSKKDISTQQRCEKIIDELSKLVQKPKNDIIKSFYGVRQTFGLVPADSHNKVIDFMAGELKKAPDYYKTPDLELAVYEYIASCCLFSYGLYPPTFEYFRLLLNILNQEFFIELGFKTKYYDETTKKLNSTNVIAKINQITSKYKADYPAIHFETKYLKFDSLQVFCEGYLKEFKYIGLS